jgi:large subunit ribosomal protein L35
MPKLKTHKGTSKRIKVTSTGKFLRMKGYRGHLRRNRSNRAKSQYDKMQHTAVGDAKRLALLLPYGTT